MKNFHKLAAGLDVMPLMHAVACRSNLWNQHRFRTTFKNTPHADADDIWLRYARENLVENPDQIAGVINDADPIFYDAWDRLPQAHSIVYDIMRRVQAYQLGRVLITRLRPGGRILAHADTYGAYVEQPDVRRYHVVLQGLPGSLYTCGDETVAMLTGEVWWFNAYERHEVVNNSADDRVHLLVDVLAR